MLSLLALACWIGGLIVLPSNPWIGSMIAASGFVFAGKAVFRPDDMAFMFGVIFMLVIAVSLLRLVGLIFGFNP